MAASLKSAEEGFKFTDSSSSEMIDLCNDDDDGEFFSQNNKRLGRRRKNPNRKNPRFDERKDDAVILDQVREEDLSEDDVYRQAVGPHRMGFISSWTSAHNFAATKSSHRIPKTLYNELLEFQLNLPIAKNSSIFIRVDESRLDLLRCLITGPVDTPYSLGCFFFDILLNDYPRKPPMVRFLTTDAGRVRFNPNLYQCGKVCLSLLGKFSFYDTINFIRSSCFPRYMVRSILDSWPVDVASSSGQYSSAYTRWRTILQRTGLRSHSFYTRGSTFIKRVLQEST